jgi:hypothetical protein
MLWLLLACGGKSEDSNDGQNETGLDQQDTAEEILSCENSDTPFSDFVIQETGVSTVFKVSWTAEGDSHYLHFVDSAGFSRFIVAESDNNQHTAISVGLVPLEETTLRPAIKIGDEVFCGTGQSVRPDVLSTGLPELSLEGEPQDGFFITALTTESTRFAAVLNGAGQFVWANEVPFENGCADCGPLTEVLLTEDEKSLAYFTFDNTDPGSGVFYEVSFEGEELRTVPVPGWHLSFTTVENGVFAGLGHATYLRPDGVEIYGDTIVELSPDGTLTEVWNSFDAFSPEPDSPYYDEMVDDWMHTNFLTYDAARGKYLVSLGRINGVAQIDRATGGVDWMASGHPIYATDIRPEDEQDFPYLISNPHSIQWLGDDRVLIFNRGFPEAEIGMSCSEATELQLDLNTRRMTKVWSSPSEECLAVIFLGEAHRLDTGETLSIWSDKGQLDIFNSDSNSIWKVNLDFGAIFGFGMWTDELAGMR